MAKTSAIAIPLRILIVFITACSVQSKVETTELTFYVHEFRSGPDATLIPVAGIPGKKWGVNQFGSILAGDHLLTEGISVDSPVVGRLDGIVVVASLDADNLEVLVSVLFTTGKYEGSTVELKGLKRGSDAKAEVAVVGGTRKFRYAQGYAQIETVINQEDYVVFKSFLHIKQDLELLEAEI